MAIFQQIIIIYENWKNSITLRDIFKLPSKKNKPLIQLWKKYILFTITAVIIGLLLSCFDKSIIFCILSSYKRK